MMQSLTRPNNTLGEEMYSVSSESEVMTVVMASFVLAKEIGFNAVEVNEVSTSVSELAMNIVKYAQRETSICTEL